MSDLDSFLDDLFLGVAFAAFVEESIHTGAEPCPEKTRVRAYRYYEAALAEKSRSLELQKHVTAPAKAGERTLSHVA